MATITLDTLWLNAANDLSDAMSFPAMSALSSGPTTGGEVRMYANGRTRLITRAGTPRTTRARLPLCTREQVLWLEAHAGQVVLVRDAQGRKFYGVFFSPVFEEYGAVYDGASVEITLTEVSYDEAV